MDSIINAAALALATGDVLGALNRVALRTDPPALALHGIAMARLGDFAVARALLRKAGQGFGRREEKSAARCVVAEAEIALVSRDLGWPAEKLEQAEAILRRSGDMQNALHARTIAIRRLLLLGKLDEAEAGLAGLEPERLTPPLATAYWLARAGIAMRRLQATLATEDLERAKVAAAQSRITPLIAEVDAARQTLEAPAALLRTTTGVRPVTLAEIEAIFATDTLVVDATRNMLRRNEESVALPSRPVLFALAEAIGEAWPADVSRETLLVRAFGARHADESHRARLRVEMTRLRQMIAPLARVVATEKGYRLETESEVAVLAFPLRDQNASVLALLGDGQLWSSSALALVLDLSARTVQRALEDLRQDGKVEAIGRGRSRRWAAKSVPGFPTTLLAPPVG